MRSTSTRSLLVLPICVGWILSCSSSSHGPGEAVRQFYMHLNEGDYSSAMALYSSEATEVLEDPSLSSETVFAEWADAETRQGRIDGVKLITEDRDAETATIEFEVLYTDGSSKTSRVTLTREDGQWKLGLIG